MNNRRSLFRGSLLAGVAMTRAERAKGRFMRAPDHPGDGGGGNNAAPPPAGNSGDSTSETSEQNNTGNEFDPAAFWNSPASAGDGAPSGESGAGKQGESGTQEPSNFGQELATRLSTLTFGDPVFNDEVAGQINEGNFTGVQDRLNAMGQSIVREALAMQVKILRPFAEQLMEQVRQETNQTFNNRDNVESLERLFPAAKNPAMAKTIQPIYDQALLNAKGDRTKAVEATKEMLRFMAGESAKDLGVEVLPRGEGGMRSPSPNTNWLDELTSR